MPLSPRPRKAGGESRANYGMWRQRAPREPGRRRARTGGGGGGGARRRERGPGRSPAPARAQEGGGGRPGGDRARTTQNPCFVGNGGANPARRPPRGGEAGENPPRDSWAGATDGAPAQLNKTRVLFKGPGAAPADPRKAECGPAPCPRPVCWWCRDRFPRPQARLIAPLDLRGGFAENWGGTTTPPPMGALCFVPAPQNP